MSDRLQCSQAKLKFGVGRRDSSVDERRKKPPLQADQDYLVSIRRKSFGRRMLILLERPRLSLKPAVCLRIQSAERLVSD